MLLSIAQGHRVEREADSPPVAEFAQLDAEWAFEIAAAAKPPHAAEHNK